MGPDGGLNDAREPRSGVARIPHPEDQGRRREAGDGCCVTPLEKRLERPFGLFSEFGGPDQGISKAVPYFKDRDRLLLRIPDVDLRDQAGARVLGRPRLGFAENRLDPVRLGSNAVDRGDSGAVRQRVDVVAGVLIHRVRRREDGRAGPFHRLENLAQVQRNRPLRVVGPAVHDLVSEWCRHGSRCSPR